MARMLRNTLLIKSEDERKAEETAREEERQEVDTAHDDSASNSKVLEQYVS
jgi:hypothetical protein